MLYCYNVESITQNKLNGRRAEAPFAIYCNKGLQPFADTDKVQIFDMLGIDVPTASGGQIKPLLSTY